MASMYVAAFGAWLFLWACDSATAKAGHVILVFRPDRDAIRGGPYRSPAAAVAFGAVPPCRLALLWAELRV